VVVVVVVVDVVVVEEVSIGGIVRNDGFTRTVGGIVMIRNVVAGIPASPT